MKVVSKQSNSRMCIICGMENPLGVQAQFYNMEDGSVMTPFRFRKEHQSYPQRVHGGMIAAMLDELGLRACWANAGGEEIWGVTMALQVKYRKPVPYDADLIGRGRVTFVSPRFLKIEAELFDSSGLLLANADMKYIRMEIDQIADNSDLHEATGYLLPDDVTEIAFCEPV